MRGTALTTPSDTNFARLFTCYGQVRKYQGSNPVWNISAFAVLSIVGLTTGFAPLTFAQQVKAVDSRTAQEIRALARRYDEAINKQDPGAVAAFYTEDAIYVAHHGTFHGRQAIKKTYADYFQHWHAIHHISTVDRLIAVGNEVRAFGTWSSAFQDVNGVPGKDEGHYRWLLVRENDVWEIRTNTNRSSNFNATN
jgi:uncharacterized protein (TIGR02246 family)